MAQWSPSSSLAHTVVQAGFLYDPQQDIIFSRMDALQRQFGYAYGYDDSIFIINAVIDCEPIFFAYAGKTWMIELWKGQYGLMTGCEIGVYNRSSNSSQGYDLLDRFLGKRDHDTTPSHNKFFDCAGDNELLEMSFTLKRRGQKLFSRGPEKHWWLTGFKWGELSDPDDLSMEVEIRFPNYEMIGPFKDALVGLKYGFNVIGGLSVRFTFDRPRTFQPRKDPAKQTELAAVNNSNRDLVARYKALGLSSNDPNSVGNAAGWISDSIAIYGQSFFKQVWKILSKQPERILNELLEAIARLFRPG
jgi:Domain of unknown function (DUF4474)